MARRVTSDRSNEGGKRLNRRALLAGVAGAAGAIALGRAVEAQTPQPAVTPMLASQPAPAATPPPDPTKVQGHPPTKLGTRSPFADAYRLPGPTSSTTPLDKLYGIVTPSALHYERHHAGVPFIDPSRYTLLIHGLVQRPTVYSIEDLKRFPSVTRIMFLECSGNSGAAWTGAPASTTVQMLNGLTSTSEWTGVPVVTLMNEVGASPDATWVLAEGSDAAVMTRSVPMDKLMLDGFVAYAQNGEDIRPEQGYPARLLLPGWEGNINIKWLRRLKLGTAPFETREETSKYTDPLPSGQARQFTFVMEAKSTITRPAGGATIPAPGFWEVTGIAWSGRGMITRVEVSSDGGQKWGDAVLQEPVLPIAHTRFRFPWTWDGSEAVLQSRATDETGYVQPTRTQLVAVRGVNSIYHFNGIDGWHVATDGTVSYVQS